MVLCSKAKYKKKRWRWFKLDSYNYACKLVESVLKKVARFIPLVDNDMKQATIKSWPAKTIVRPTTYLCPMMTYV